MGFQVKIRHYWDHCIKHMGIASSGVSNGIWPGGSTSRHLEHSEVRVPDGSCLLQDFKA